MYLPRFLFAYFRFMIKTLSAWSITLTTTWWQHLVKMANWNFGSLEHSRPVNPCCPWANYTWILRVFMAAIGNVDSTHSRDSNVCPMGRKADIRAKLSLIRHVSCYFPSSKRNIQKEIPRTVTDIARSIVLFADSSCCGCSGCCTWRCLFIQPEYF